MYSEDGVYKITWGGGSDSYYEYLLKYWVYDPSKTDYLDTWKAAADTTIKVILNISSEREYIMLT